MKSKRTKILDAQFLASALFALGAIIYFFVSIIHLRYIEQKFGEIDIQMLSLSNRLQLNETQSAWKNMGTPTVFDYKQTLEDIIRKKDYTMGGDPYPVFYGQRIEGTDMDGNPVNVEKVLLLIADTQMKPISDALCDHFMTVGFEKRGNRHYGCLSINGTNTIWQEIK